MSVNGADDLDKKLKQLAEYDMMHAVSDAIQLVRSAAVNNCSVNTGELRQSIFADVEGNMRKENVSLAPFRNSQEVPFFKIVRRFTDG